MKQNCDISEIMNVKEAFPLTENEMRENADKYDWNFISMFQDISEAFIEENSDRINFYMMFYCNDKVCDKISYEFLTSNIDKVELKHIPRFKKLTEEEKNLIRNIVEMGK